TASCCHHPNHPHHNYWPTDPPSCFLDFRPLFPYHPPYRSHYFASPYIRHWGSPLVSILFAPVSRHPRSPPPFFLVLAPQARHPTPVSPLPKPSPVARVWNQE